MADPHSKILVPLPPSLLKFLHYHAVFGNFWPNARLVAPFRIDAQWETLDPLLITYATLILNVKICIQGCARFAKIVWCARKLSV